MLSGVLWPSLFSGIAGTIIWIIVTCLWCVSLWRSYRRLGQLRTAPAGDQDLFIQAQVEYLKGHWFEAESLLNRTLKDFPRDADVHLMLATLFRHTERYEEARHQLEQLQRLDGASKWFFEIATELQRLDQLTVETTELAKAA